jgi:subtilase family serine protease
VTNNGDADAGPSSISNRVDRKFIGGAGYDQVLSPGESIDVGPFPPVTVTRGAHLVTFALDAKHEVAESNELDNLIAFAIICY